MTSHGRMSTQTMLSHLMEYYVALKAMSLKLFNSVEKCFQKCLSGKKTQTTKWYRYCDFLYTEKKSTQSK